jgi:uncharacterized protein YqgC (DUF456 family)
MSFLKQLCVTGIAVIPFAAAMYADIVWDDRLLWAVLSGAAIVVAAAGAIYSWHTIHFKVLGK